MIRIWLFILMIGLASGVEVGWSCPDDIYVGEEFECGVEVVGGEGRYDLKVEIDKKRDSVLKIWDGEWKSGYYYLKEFVKDDESVRLRIDEVERYDVTVKLRKGDWREEFDVGRIKVKEKENYPRTSTNEHESLDTGATSLKEESGIISLNADTYVDSDDKWDYVSKDGWVVDMLPYWFCLFLICLIGVLLVDRF